MLYTLHKANPKLRSAIIKNSNNELIKALSEISLNMLRGNIDHTQAIRQKLKKYKSKIRCLPRSKGSVKANRNILVQQGGFLPVLLGSILSGVIGSLLQNV